jgi:hypothetical protein
MLAGAGLFLFLGVLAQAATPPAVVNGAMVIARSVVAEGDLVVFHASGARSHASSTWGPHLSMCSRKGPRW